MRTFEFRILILKRTLHGGGGRLGLEHLRGAGIHLNLRCRDTLQKRVA